MKVILNLNQSSTSKTKKQNPSFGVHFIKANKLGVIVPDNSTFLIKQNSKLQQFLYGLESKIKIYTPEGKKIKLSSKRDIPGITTDIDYAVKQADAEGVTIADLKVNL